MFLLFDIGGTKIRLALSSDGKSLGTPVVIPSPPQFKDAVQALKRTISDLTRGQKIEMAAGGVAGPLDQNKSMVTAAPNLPEWNGRPLKAELEHIIQSPVVLENDTVMVGLGEVASGAGQGRSIVAYLTVSTGVGGCRFVNGMIDESSLGFEPGHQIIKFDGIECTCGGHGHLEGYISGHGFEKRFHRSPQDIDDLSIWDEAARLLAVGLNNLAVMWSPDCIILGGTMMKDISIEKAAAYLKDLDPILPKIPSLLPAKLGDFGGLHGALAFLRQKHTDHKTR